MSLLTIFNSLTIHSFSIHHNKKDGGMLIIKAVLCVFALAAIDVTVENLLSHQFIEHWLCFHARIQLYCCKQEQKLL